MSGASTQSKHRPRRRNFAFVIAASFVLAATSLAAGAPPHSKPAHTKQNKKVPEPPPPPPLSDGITDMSRAVPLRSLLKQPSSADQYRSLSNELSKDKPEVDTAKAKSEALARQAADLQRKLVDTAAKVEDLEREKIQIDADVVRLTAENDRLSADFARDRVAVSHLLAVLERLQHDVPPAMAVRPDDALAAARSAMLIGASLPGVYHEAAALARRIEMLQRTRAALVTRRAEAVRNSANLAQARVELDQLLAMKRLEAEAAATRYGVLKTRLDTVAAEAGNLQALLKKVAQLGSAPTTQSVVTVNAVSGSRVQLSRGWLIAPVVGSPKPGGVDGVGGSSAPGITYTAMPSATVISPADGKVIFAKSMPKAGLVLILEIGDGYDAVLAGLDRLDVRPGNDVLMGEPVGAMSKFDHEPKLYFELRQKNGRGMSPAPYIGVAPLRKAK